MNEAGINNLRLAILERARTDYRDILQGKKGDNLCNKKELENFFNSEYFNTLYFDIGYNDTNLQKLYEQRKVLLPNWILLCPISY